jgi:hypothetical protein
MQADGRVILMHITYLFQVTSIAISATIWWKLLAQLNGRHEADLTC